jgi:peptidoglycan hydrolase-like protein with peptidoglycan-binding domain
LKPTFGKISFLLCLPAALLGICFSSVAFAQTQPTAGAFSRNLTIGDFGGDVLSLQAELLAEGYLKVGTPTGYFGSLTAKALADWQGSVGLPATGYFGPLSQDVIEGKPVALVSKPVSAPVATSMSARVSVPVVSTSLMTSSNFTIGDVGSGISLLQSILIAQGYLPLTNPTGYFGYLTSAALAQWQRVLGLPNTGYFGPLTRAKLGTLLAGFIPTVPTAMAAPPSTAPIYFGGGGGGGGGGGSENPPAIVAAAIVQAPAPSSPTPPAPPAPIVVEPPTPVPTSTPTPTLTPTSTPPVVIPPVVMPPVTTPVLSSGVGISLGSGFLELDSATQNQEFDSMVSLGVQWIRVDMQWKIVQAQNSSTYNWSQIDAAVAEANAHHLKVLAILDYAPAWAASSSCAAGSNCAPAVPATFAAFAAAAAQRYDPEGVAKWEIWNEPNAAAFWGGASDCGAYTADLKAAYVAIKQVDPNAGVISGGLAGESTDGHNISPADFLSCIYSNGGKGYFDAVGDHPYSFPQDPSAAPQSAWGQMSETTPSLRSIMTANGDGGKRIWITEFGAPTNGPDPQSDITEIQQAAMVTDAMDLYKTYSWAGPFFWYTLTDDGISTSTNENFFGLMRPDGSLKPAYTTLQSVISAGL